MPMSVTRMDDTTGTRADISRSISRYPLAEPNMFRNFAINRAQLSEGCSSKKDDEDDNNDDDGTKRPYHACSAGRESSWLSCNCSRLVPSSLIPFALLRPTGLLPESSKHWANTRTTTTHTARVHDSTLSMATGKSMKRPYRERVPPACVLVKGCVFHSKQFFPILSFSIFHSSETCRRPSHFLQGL